MPFEIINSLRGASIVRATGPGTYTIALNDLRKNPTTETVTDSSIRRMMWSTNGNISIVRNSVEIASVHNAGEMRFDEYSHSLSNNSTQSIVITIATGGTIVMELSKTATYNVDPSTGVTL
jgi:hypothetical protein